MNEEALVMEHWRLWSMDRNIPDYKIWIKQKEIHE